MYKPYIEEDNSICWEYADMYIIVPEEINITEEQERLIQKEIKKIHTLLIKDINTVLKKSKKKWFNDLGKNPNEKDIIGIYPDYPFRKIDSNKWGMRFKLSKRLNMEWFPIRVIKYSKDLKVKKIKKEYLNDVDELDEEYKDRDDLYEFVNEYEEIPTEYMDEWEIENMGDDSDCFDCEYAKLSSS